MKRTFLLCLFGVAIVSSGLMAYRTSGKYGSGPVDDPRVYRERNERGELTKLVYDVNGNRKPDTTSYLSNGIVQRTEVDRDEDGRVDVWYLYGPTGKLIKTGTSSTNNGIADTWVDEPANDSSPKKSEKN